MGRALVFGVMTLGLVAVGYTADRAQSTSPSFEIVVDAPSGATTVRCVKGCVLAWVERGINPNAKRLQEFQFSCTGGATCSSARIGGWLEP